MVGKGLVWKSRQQRGRVVLSGADGEGCAAGLRRWQVFGAGWKVQGGRCGGVARCEGVCWGGAGCVGRCRGGLHQRSWATALRGVY